MCLRRIRTRQRCRRPPHRQPCRRRQPVGHLPRAPARLLPPAPSPVRPPVLSPRPRRWRPPAAPRNPVDDCDLGGLPLGPGGSRPCARAFFSRLTVVLEIVVFVDRLPIGV